MKAILAAITTLLAGAYLAGSLIALARRKPGYSHWRHTLSELGETGAPDQRLVALAVFLPIGLALLVAAWLLRAQPGQVAGLALCLAVGYGGAAAFPCDPGSPLSGSWRQGLHNLAGGVQYVGGGLTLSSLGSLHPVLRFAGYAVLAAVVLLSLPDARSPRGLVQRFAECCLFGGLALAAWRIGAATG